MLESPEEGSGAEPLAWPRLRLVHPVPAETCSHWTRACARRAGLQNSGASIHQIGVQLASQEQSSRFISILGVCLL